MCLCLHVYKVENVFHSSLMYGTPCCRACIQVSCSSDPEGGQSLTLSLKVFVGPPPPAEGASMTLTELVHHLLYLTHPLVTLQRQHGDYDGLCSCVCLQRVFMHVYMCVCVHVHVCVCVAEGGGE